MPDVFLRNLALRLFIIESQSMKRRRPSLSTVQNCQTSLYMSDPVSADYTITQHATALPSAQHTLASGMAFKFLGHFSNFCLPAELKLYESMQAGSGGKMGVKTLR